MTEEEKDKLLRQYSLQMMNTSMEMSKLIPKNEKILDALINITHSLTDFADKMIKYHSSKESLN